MVDSYLTTTDIYIVTSGLILMLRLSDKKLNGSKHGVGEEVNECLHEHSMQVYISLFVIVITHLKLKVTYAEG